MKLKSRGFTLIELLMALSIGAVVMAAIASLLFSSFQVLRIINGRQDALLENSLIALEKIQREIQKSPVYPAIAFSGKSDSVSFPEIVSLETQDVYKKPFQLGQIQTAELGAVISARPIRYFFDASKGTLMRQVGDQDSREVLKGIQKLEFSYLISPIGKSEWKWKDETPDSGSLERIGAMRMKVFWDMQNSSYTIPGVQRTFLVYRRHFLSSEILHES